MRRFYVLAIAAVSVYCLTDAFASNGGETAGHANKPVFSAEIVDAPIVATREPIVSNDVAVPTAQAPNRAESDAATASDANPPAAKPAAPVTGAHLAKPRMAIAAPRGPSRHAAKADTIVQKAALPVPLPAYAAPIWQPPVLRVAVAQRSPALSGCSGGKWSQPDAAGVPVLICD